MSDDDMFEVFGDFDATAHRSEAETKWGTSEAYRESSRRTTRYGKDEWRTIKAEGDAITAALGERLAEGASADDPAVLDLAERHRLQIDRWFYPCSHEMHRGLGEMYVNDPRFAATYERVQPGLAAFLRDAIAANAAAHGG